MYFRLKMYLLQLFCIFAAINTLTGEFSGMLDLSWKFDENTVYWKSVRPFSYTKKFAGVREDGLWYAMNEFCAGEHGGTHLDAPIHFYDRGLTVADISLSKLIVPGVVIDLTKSVELNGSCAVLRAEDLEKWEEENGHFPKNCVLLVRFGWSKYYDNKTAYMGVDQNDQLNFPGLSPEAATWIVNSGKFVGVGLDTPSVDPGQNRRYEAHCTLAKKQMYILENVNILATLPAKGFTLLILPMKLAGGTGAPVRIVAISQALNQVVPEVPEVQALKSDTPRVPFLGHFALVIALIIVVGCRYYDRVQELC